MGPLKAMVSEYGVFVVVLFEDDGCLPTAVMIQAIFAQSPRFAEIYGDLRRFAAKDAVLSCFNCAGADNGNVTATLALFLESMPAGTFPF